MSDPHRPLSEGKITAFELLKLAYDDADDVREEPRQFAVKMGELMAAGATSSDLLWLLKRRYAEHVREITHAGESRRQFREANGLNLTPESCFFLTYAGKSFAHENRLRCGASSVPGERDTPQWDAAEGKLYWRGMAIAQLATHAYTERELLGEFERRGWESPIDNPIARDPIGDATQARRSAVKNLNRHLGEDSPIVFFCLQGDFMGWRAGEGELTRPGKFV